MSEGKQTNRVSAASLSAPDIPESQLTRMDPDSILADETDPDGLLGNDSESEAGGAGGKRASRRADASALKRISSASAASSIFSNEMDRDSQQGGGDLPKTPDLDKQAGSETFPTALQTPRQATFDKAARPSTDREQQLEEQVKDLTTQVTGLNGKLVQSFERISDLEDDLSDSQERVKAMTAKIAELEKERQEHLAALNTGLLVEKAHVSSEMQRMMDRVIEETAQRGKAESDKQRIESELDELSSSLFNEANKMVAVERLARARAEEKSKQMEERLKDTEGIMLDQQKVLGDLQRQVEKLQSGRKADDDTASVLSKDSDAASTHLLKASALARSTSERSAIQRNQVILGSPLSTEARVLINIVPYQEFRAFVAHLRKLRKQLSPFYNYPLPGAGGLETVSSPARGSPRSPSSPAPHANGNAQTHLVTYSGVTAYSQGYSNSSNSGSPFAASGLSRHRDYPQLPSTVENMVYLPSQLSLPFIKRSQEEDVDPCLRLDFAPGLNWLSRRQANTAILEGNLVIEPIFPGGKAPDEAALRREHSHLPPAGCAMCGIPVVNIPLPGAAANSTAPPEQGTANSLLSSSIASATTSWASSAANSLREVTGSSTSRDPTGTLSTKSSRPSLFSSFRRSAGASKSASTGSVSLESEPPVLSTATTQAPGDEVGGHALQPSLMDAALPVPTHIFRIQEGASNRYLLCPHHCLTRLRAACQFWGFIRTMERSIVLEGKHAVDETAPTMRPPLPPKAAQPTDDGASTASAKDTGKDEAIASEPAGAGDEPSRVTGSNEQAADAEAKEEPTRTSTTAAETPTSASDEKPEADRDVDSAKVTEPAADSADTSADADSTKEDTASKDEEEASTALDGSKAEGADSDDDDGFADAQSSPKVKAQDTEGSAVPQASEEGGKGEDEADTPLALSVVNVNEDAKDDTAGAGEDEAEAKGPTAAIDTETAVASTTESTASAKPIVPPPVPRRSAARGSGASSPAPPASSAAPTLPPRRVPRTEAAALPADVSNANDAPLEVVAPVRTSLSLTACNSLDWEDKMWTEITKLKEELWKARIGLVLDGQS